MATKNGAARAIEDKEWEEMKKQLRSIIRLFSGLLFVPTAGLFLAVGYGAQAGLIAMTEKLLEIMRCWWEEKP